MKSILILFLAFFLHSCQSSIVKDNYKVLDMDSAIQQMKENGIIDELIFKDKQKAYLDDSEIQLLTKILNASVDTYNSRPTSSDKINIKEYNFYFIPTLDENNNKWIFIYAYCFSEGTEWYTYGELLHMADGGVCRFRTVINLTKNIEGWIIPNGEA
jgi:hypothetical protein